MLQLSSQRLHKRTLFWLLVLITLAGDALVVNGLRALMKVGFYDDALIVELMIVGLLVAPWSVKMPSGTAWRPGVPLMMMSIFMLPPGLAVMVNIPALILITARARGPWWKYCETIAHATLGLYLGGIAYLSCESFLPGNYYTRVLAAVIALLVHLVVNRLISAVIVAHRDERPLVRQLIYILMELHWGYFGSYLLIIMTSMVSEKYAAISIIVVTLVLFFIFKMVSAYSQVHILQTSAHTDGLTSLENRTSWEMLLDTYKNSKVATGTRISMVDLDNLKNINDRYGHLVGDEILRRIANTLKFVAPEKSRLFRIGGDEFVIYAPISFLDKDVEGIIRQQVVKEFRDYNEIEEAISVSVGTAYAPNDGNFLIDLFQVSDQRMYDDKNNTKYKESSLELGIPASVMSLVLAIESRDAYTSGHSLRVAFYAWQLARQMHLSVVVLEPVFRGGLVHDVGKIGVPDAILNNPGKLSAEEYSIMKQHPETGYEMCRKLGFSSDELDIIRYHHERWDGKGYPIGLIGEQIPLLARIAAVVDVYDALTSNRAYRTAWTHQGAMEYLLDAKNTQFDPSCVDTWIELNALNVQKEKYEEWARNTNILSKDVVYNN